LDASSTLVGGANGYTVFSNKASQLTAGIKYIKIVFPGLANWQEQLSKVTFQYYAEPTAPPEDAVKAVFTDEGADLSKLYAKSAHIGNASAQPEKYGNDSTRIIHTNDDAINSEYIIYKSPDADIYSFEIPVSVFFNLPASSVFAIYGSTDGINFTKIPVSPTMTSSASGFNTLNYKATSISRGYRYLKVEFPYGTIESDNWTASINKVSFVYGVTSTIPVSGVTLDKTALSLKVGEASPLSATVAPDNAANKAVTWSSSNPAVATVDNNGTVTGAGAGSATIKVTTADGSKTADCIVQVLIVDNTPPTTTSTVYQTANNGWYNTDVTVSLSAGDSDGSGVAATHYIVNGGAQQTGTSIALTTDGEHTLVYWSVDNAGNIEAQHTTTIKIDKTVPTAVVSYSPTSPTYQDVVATITPSESVTITNNGGSSSYNFYFNGSFTFEFVDAAGNQGTATATVNNIVSKSKAKPGSPILSNDNGYDTGLLDGTYNVTMNMWSGENGRVYKLYENDVLIETKILTDNSPNAQKAVTAISGKKNGTYRYFAELTNAFGTTTSSIHVVTVTKASPDKPVLSNDNWDGDGNFKVTMNMWWGTNGITYNLYENGVLIYTQALTNNTPAAQSALTTVTNKAIGTYQYRGELVNYAGATSSETMAVNVTK
jgi:uncharacterized protein YjdB